ncbi:hypothetical protein ACP6PL_10650, partial [Dapis sp. BLCC M126]|uniref:hypothetical protein n=1 Tax=Dapis sp. BLCC M126 TaxID=3400189 RepID=UPI003CF28502
LTRGNYQLSIINYQLMKVVFRSINHTSTKYFLTPESQNILWFTQTKNTVKLVHLSDKINLQPEKN